MIVLLREHLIIDLKGGQFGAYSLPGNLGELHSVSSGVMGTRLRVFLRFFQHPLETLSVHPDEFKSSREVTQPNGKLDTVQCSSSSTAGTTKLYLEPAGRIQQLSRNISLTSPRHLDTNPFFFLIVFSFLFFTLAVEMDDIVDVWSSDVSTGYS